MSKIVFQFDTADGPAAGIAAISDALFQLVPLNVRAVDDDTVAVTMAR